MKSISKLPQLERLEPLKALNPLSYERVFLINSLSGAQLLRVSIELLYQSSLELDSGSFDNELILRRVYHANKLIEATNNSKELYFMSDIRALCKALKIKSPL